MPPAVAWKNLATSSKKKTPATPVTATKHAHDHPAQAQSPHCDHDHAHGEHCSHDHPAHAHHDGCCGHDHSVRPKHIYVYSPSGAVRDKAAFKRAIKRLEGMGHQVEVDADALSSHQRFAGDDATRIASIHRAAAIGADVALISRGGYGLTRILPGIDYQAVAKAVEQGTHFVGLSDFTAFNSVVGTNRRHQLGGPGADCRLWPERGRGRHHARLL